MSNVDSIDASGLRISPRQRLTLQRVLAGEMRRCSESALRALQGRGLLNGPDNNYQLTRIGREIAESLARAAKVAQGVSPS